MDEQDSTPFQWQHEARQDAHPKWARHIVIEVKIHGHLWVLFSISKIRSIERFYDSYSVPFIWTNKERIVAWCCCNAAEKSPHGNHQRAMETGFSSCYTHRRNQEIFFIASFQSIVEYGLFVDFKWIGQTSIISWRKPKVNKTFDQMALTVILPDY